jgi:predicted nucleotide-binding protein (sugar kinase/HSP70/actin superfamily)
VPKIGIPRGLFYYYYYPLVKTFFTDLGAEIVLSSRTTRLTVDSGIEAAVDEPCFPIKVYFGHVRELCQQDIDYLFVPRIVSIESKSYICPKFMGIPDMVKACLDNLPKLIDFTVDLSGSDKIFKKDLEKVGRLFAASRRDVKAAYEHGLAEVQNCKAIAAQGYTMSEAIEIWDEQQSKALVKGELRIGVLGHGYSLYDETISMNIINRLRQMGCTVILPEMLDQEDIEQQAATLEKRIFWTLGRKMVGSALRMENMDNVDGIIYVACFGCGPDSFIGEIIERKIKKKAFMLMVVDEHTGEGGLVTRLEAFCDMLKRREQRINENYLSAHG